MKTLFLGSTGFVGRALLKNLSTEFQTTLVLSGDNDQLPSGHETIIGDLRDEDTLQIIRKGNYLWKVFN
jgi:nucleoside-diphosphate-sugar epimerase